MDLSRKWLNEFVDGVSPDEINDKEFSEAMTLSGSKVETYRYLGEEISNVVVGRVLTLERHPDSDHMWVCRIDVGQKEPVQIVTGAWNVHVGDLVPVALHKSTLPGGKRIERGKLRGVESNGMEMLIHVGVDTVQMNGDGFTCLVKEGDAVKAGQPLIRFDRDKIRAAFNLTDPNLHVTFERGIHWEIGMGYGE